MISLKNYRASGEIKGAEKRRKKRKKTTTPNHGMERSSRKIKLCLGSYC